MANKHPVIKGKTAKHGHELAQRVRAGILNAFDAADKRGKVLSEVLADALLANPLKFLDTASKYVPKDIDITTTNTTATNLSDSELADIIAQRARLSLESEPTLVNNRTGK